MPKITIHDEAAFVKRYPALTKTVPAVAAHTAPDKRKIASFIKMGGQVDGITIEEGEEEAGPKTTPNKPPALEKVAEKQATQTGPEKPDPEAKAIAETLTGTVPAEQRAAFLRGAGGDVDYTAGKKAYDGETPRDFHRRCQLEYEAEKKAKP